MTINSLQYILREVWNSIRRNLWLSLASVLTVMVSLVILGASAFFLLNASNMAESFESQLEVAVFAEDSLSKSEVEDLKEEVEGLSGVASVELVPKEEAFDEISKTVGSNSIVEDLGENPLPDKLTVKVTDAQLVKSVAEEAANLSGVGSVKYGDGFLEKVLQFTSWLRWVGVAVVIAFATASLVLISLNIKMTVFSRRREIQIMKLVGASNGFIRWPFLLEGMVLGLVGGILATLIVGFGYYWLADYVQSTLTFMPIVSESTRIYQVLGALLLVGMGLGAAGSAISLRKFLKA